MKTGIVMDERYKEHNMGAFHPESPQRLEAIYGMVKEEISFTYEKIEPRPATEEEIQAVHSASYVRMIKETSGKDRVMLDPDTSTSARSYEVALLAAGGLLSAVDMVMAEKLTNGFALVRPPGHHAEASRAMGFCIFNNVAVAAEYLLRKHSLKRIMIVDWDLHHGNGTQHSFYSREDVLYFSTHQFPYYPGTGNWDETGSGRGEGFTVNVPLRPGKGDADFLFIFRNLLQPLASAFMPEFILVSAGFDIYRDDPLGGMEVSPEGFAVLTDELLSLSHRVCGGRLLFSLEGGYDLNGLREGVKHVLGRLAGEGETLRIEDKLSSSTESELEPVFKMQRKLWKI
ncbi:MAG: histone deacetylase [Candidatus Aminicenantales bacterium]